MKDTLPDEVKETRVVSTFKDDAEKVKEGAVAKMTNHDFAHQFNIMPTGPLFGFRY